MSYAARRGAFVKQRDLRRDARDDAGTKKAAADGEKEVS